MNSERNASMRFVRCRIDARMDLFIYDKLVVIDTARRLLETVLMKQRRSNVAQLPCPNRVADAGETMDAMPSARVWVTAFGVRGKPSRTKRITSNRGSFARAVWCASISPMLFMFSVATVFNRPLRPCRRRHSIETGWNLALTPHRWQMDCVAFTV